MSIKRKLERQIAPSIYWGASNIHRDELLQLSRDMREGILKLERKISELNGSQDAHGRKIQGRKVAS